MEWYHWLIVSVLYLAFFIFSLEKGNYKYWVKIIGIFYCAFLIGMMAGSRNYPFIGIQSKKDISKEVVFVPVRHNVAVPVLGMESQVMDALVKLRVKHPDIALKQAKIESGNFTSNVFLSNNNLFGMKMPYKRPTLAIGEHLGYAVYRNWWESVVDYALWQTYSAKGKNRQDYLDILENVYAEDSNYRLKID